MKESVLVAEEPFRHGTPRCKYDQVSMCSQDSDGGRLFRLLDSTTKSWYFYNDTTDMLAKVCAVIKPGSEVYVLEDARMWTRQGPKGREKIIEAEVKPCSTVRFMQGAPKGFELEVVMEPAPIDELDLKLKRKPQYRYDRAYTCFKDSNKELFFRLVDSQNHIWYFHNDTHDYVLSASGEFHDLDTVKALGNTEKMGVPENDSGGVIYYVSVNPGVTEPFITGDPKAYCLRFNAEHMDKEKPLDPSEIVYENDGPDEAISGNPIQVYKCFTKKGNGLLFRLVDEERRTWSFYNDTTQNIMRIALRLPESEKITVSCDAQAVPDPECPGMTLVTMVVPPLATRRLLDGLPASYELSFTAEVVVDPISAGKAAFRYGGPNPKIMRYDQVFSTWRGSSPDEGELFRLVDTRQKRWGFYNDTQNLALKVHVKFITDGKLSPLGTTRMEVDRDGKGMWYAADIPPLATVRFVQGDYSGFELRLRGTTKKGTRRSCVMKQ